MAPFKILIINPNTNKSMTDSLRAPIESLDYNNTTYTYLTAPTGVPSINNLHDADVSATHTLPHIVPLIPTHDAFLIACYSPHPLIAQLKARIGGDRKPVVGIFEASVVVGGMLVCGGEGGGGNGGEEGGDRDTGGERFGIVSTGDAWKDILERAVREDLLGGERAGGVFGGVETCGVDAGGLHGGEGVEGRVRDAVGRLVRGGKGRVRVVLLGCAGMVGMEGWVRDVGGEGVRVVDGVRAGVGVLQGLVRGGF